MNDILTDEIFPRGVSAILAGQKQPTNSSIGGYSITYVCEGVPYCGDCIGEAIERFEPLDRELGQGLTYHDTDSGEHPTTCDTCNVEVSN